jgi:hypothetical protein
MQYVAPFCLLLLSMSLFSQDGIPDYFDIIQQAQNATRQNSTTENTEISRRYAELVDELAKARQEEDPEKRLGKIETVLERFSIGEQFQAPSIPHSYQETQGSWGVDLVEDIPGRGRSLYLVLEANRGRGNRGEPVFLVISKAPQQNLSVYIKWNSYFREIPVVEYQWDGGTWESCPQLLSPSKQTTYLDDDVSGFLSAMSSSRRLIVRTTPFASNPLLVEFKTEGFAYLASKYEDYLGPIFTQ